MAIINTANIGPDTPDVRAMAAWMRPPKYPARKARPVDRKPKPRAGRRKSRVSEKCDEEPKNYAIKNDSSTPGGLLK